MADQRLNGFFASIRAGIDNIVTQLTAIAAGINTWVHTAGQTVLGNAADLVGIGVAVPLSKLDVNGPPAFPYRATAADDAFAAGDFIVFGTGGVPGIHVVLPDSATCDRRIYILFKADGGAGVVGFRPTGADTINGANADLDLAGVNDWGIAVATTAGWLVLLQ